MHESCLSSSSPARLPLLSLRHLDLDLKNLLVHLQPQLTCSRLCYHSGSGPYNDKNPLIPSVEINAGPLDASGGFRASSLKPRRRRASFLVRPCEGRRDPVPFVCRQRGAGAAAFSHP